MQITGGYLKSRKLTSPKGENVRPTLSKTRESVFNVLMNLINFEEAIFLDVFAGSGIMGIEALSRGFSQAAFIERDKKTYNLLKENLKKLDIEPELYFGDSLKVLSKINKPFDVIYIDPPYQNNLYNSVLESIKKNNLLKDGGIIVLEHLKGEEIELTELKQIKEKVYSDKVLSFLI